MVPPGASSVDFSIVIPVYFNEGSLSQTFASINDQVLHAQSNRRGEVIFVDDGSGDNSLAELLLLQRDHPEVIRVVKLTRNFGQVAALRAGFSFVRGKCCIAMSADGQDPPALINEMLRAYFEEKAEIVICMREGRDESVYRRATSKLFYRIMRKLSFPSMPLGGFDFVLLGRKPLSILLRNQESHPFFQGQILWTGFQPKFIAYRRQERTVGSSRWSFGRKITYLIDGVVGYSELPIRFMSALGILVALCGFLYAATILVIRLVWGLPVAGWAPLMIVILVMGGLQMLMLGISGEYIWRALAQARGRDPYIVEAIYENHSTPSPQPTERLSSTIDPCDVASTTIKPWQP